MKTGLWACPIQKWMLLISTFYFHSEELQLDKHCLQITSSMLPCPRNTTTLSTELQRLVADLTEVENMQPHLFYFIQGSDCNSECLCEKNAITCVLKLLCLLLQHIAVKANITSTTFMSHCLPSTTLFLSPDIPQMCRCSRHCCVERDRCVIAINTETLVTSLHFSILHPRKEDTVVQENSRVKIRRCKWTDTSSVKKLWEKTL